MRHQMLSRMRKAPAVRAALVFAALLTAAASFGLHPEPGLPAGAPAAAGITAPGAAPAAHGCFACLVHGAALAWASAALLPAGSAEVALFEAPETAPRERLAGRDLSGRSPPARG